MSQPEKLDWGLVIATYKREEILPRCLHLAVQQTLPPQEIIVVDASPNWEKTRDNIMLELVTQHPSINWQYVQAKRASLTAQRNQGIDLATADILFLIDDDSLMYPDCAEEIMRVYSHDITHKVVGIMAHWEPLPPDRMVVTKDNQPPAARSKLRNKLQTIHFHFKQFIGQLLVPTEVNYDFPRPKYTIPATLAGMAIHQVPNLLGFCMTFRRKIFEHLHFEEILEAYAANEDIDVSFRARRHGILLRALNARICHMQAAGGRLSKSAVAALRALNQAVLNCLHNSNVAHFKKIYPKLLWRMLIKLTIKDILSRNFSCPSTRGVWFALRHYQTVFSKQPDELRAWYPGFQRKIMAELSNPNHQ
ncbi:glycosyl transferase, family 2 [Thioploca ingrica]|uniref:Glycosyl transferase, family 2 n=1 Tax=Thioploca ingrica TaxID=40754 RepID=A0A090BUG1_9GAMM|nr:glycosyl transferase, family 2 [Thioploca ingrica]